MALPASQHWFGRGAQQERCQRAGVQSVASTAGPARSAALALPLPLAGKSDGVLWGGLQGAVAGMQLPQCTSRRALCARAGGRALLDTPSRLPLTAGGDGMARHAALTGTTPSPRPACRLANLTASLPAARRASSLPPVFGSAFVSGSAPPGICVSAASAGFGCHRSSAATPLARPRLLRSRLLLRLRCERLCGRPALRAASSLRPSSGWAYAQRQQVGVEQHAAVELAG